MKPTGKQFVITALFAVWFALHATWFYYCHRYVLAGVMGAVTVAWWYWVSLIWRQRRQ